MGRVCARAPLEATLSDAHVRLLECLRWQVEPRYLGSRSRVRLLTVCYAVRIAGLCMQCWEEAPSTRGSIPSFDAPPMQDTPNR